MKKWSFQKVYNKKVHFQKIEYLVKAVKKCFLKKLNVWLALIKVTVWGINYQKGQCIYKRVYYILFFFFFGCEFGSYLKINYFIILKSNFLFLNFFFSQILANNNLPLKIYCENIVIKIDTHFNFNVLLKLFFSLSKKIIFFSPILANNNIPLKIYCESIMKILW